MASGLSPPHIAEKWEKDGRKYIRVIFEELDRAAGFICRKQIVYEVQAGPNGCEKLEKVYGSEICLEVRKT